MAAASLCGMAASALADCPGVSPGARVVTKVGYCTLNFVFRGSDGRRYAGTAGHCIPDEDDEEISGEHAWARHSGPIAKDIDGNPIGRAAYAIHTRPRDFALIQLRPSVTPNPQLCRYGGPTGINSDITDRTTRLYFYGQGMLIGDLMPARSVVAFGMPNPDRVYAFGTVVPGDSGGGVITGDGRAVGVIVTTGFHSGRPGYGLAGITRLGPQIQEAQQALGIRLRLVKAPLS